MIHSGMRRVLPIVFLAFLTLGQATPPPTPEAVRAMLSGYEASPSREAIVQLGPEVVPILRALHEDENELTFVRLRALAALRHFPTESNRRYLAAVAARENAPLFVREALLSLGRGFGRRAIEDVRPFLTRDEVAVREAAIRSLGAMRDARALALLERHREREGNQRLREMVDHMVRKKDGPAGNPTP